jgi:hypothetical protein
MSLVRGKVLEDFTHKEVPSGTINGSNTAFTLTYAPTSNDSIDVFVNGILQRLTTDYSVSGTTLTFVTAPAIAQELYVSYQYRA